MPTGKLAGVRPAGTTTSDITAAAAAVAALNAKALVNPATLAAAGARLAAAIVEMTATPTAAPNSWNVLMTPDVRPASWCWTSDSAVVVAETIVAPSPAAATVMPTTTQI